MKKRLRKKRRLGEFAELGFRLRFAMSRNLDESARNTLLDEFLDEIERLGLQFGGGGVHDGDGFTEFCGRGTATEQHRTAILSWLEQHSNIENPSAGELVDAWHGWD